MTILTVTMNPSVDIGYLLDGFKIDEVNRVQQVTKTAGGKGLNVTRVLKQLNDQPLATGLIGGELGEYIKRQLTESNIEHNFFSISGDTRNCIAILHDGKQTEILENGPVIQKNESVNFYSHFESLVMGDIDVVTISGSLPQGLPDDYYIKLIELSQAHQTPVILDSSGNSLKAVLKSGNKPTVIKPNIEELSALIGVKQITSIEQLKKELNTPLFDGIEWVVVSLGGDGAFAKHKETFYKVDIPTVEVINPVGSGDSTVAGIASGLAAHKKPDDLLKHANVLGMLNAMDAKTGNVNLEHYEKLFEQIKVREV